MKPKRRKIKSMLSDFGNLMPVPELLSYIGTLMMRRSAPVWGFALFVTFISWLNSILGYKVEENKLSLVPISVAAGFTFLGLFLKTLPAIFSKPRLIAETSHLNLMKDYRKSLLNTHLDILWNRVYQYEAEVYYNEEGIENEKLIYNSTHNYLMQTLQPVYNPNSHKDDQDNLEECVHQLMKYLPLSSKIQGTPEGFRINSIYAVEKSLPQNLQREIIGYCLGTFENYLDGAPFHESDDKLDADGSHNMLMQKIKKEVRLTGYFKPVDLLLGPYHTARDTYKRIAQKIWFPLITRAIGSRVGQAIEEFNTKYNTLRFTAQEFLWPGTEHARWIEELDEHKNHDSDRSAKELVVERRQQIIFDTFGNNLSRAEEMIDRLHLYNFEIATELRMRYDIEYALGRLEQNVRSDLKMLKVDDLYIEYQCKIAERSHKIAKEIEPYLETHPNLIDSNEKPCRKREIQRAIMTAYYTNQNNVRTHLKNGQLNLVDQELKRVIEHSGEYTEKLRYLRKFQTLSYLNIVNYLDHLKQLAYNKN